MSAWKDKERELNRRYAEGQSRMFHQSTKIVVDKHGKLHQVGITYRKPK